MHGWTPLAADGAAPQLARDVAAGAAGRSYAWATRADIEFVDYQLKELHHKLVHDTAIVPLAVLCAVGAYPVQFAPPAGEIKGVEGTPRLET